MLDVMCQDNTMMHPSIGLASVEPTTSWCVVLGTHEVSDYVPNARARRRAAQWNFDIVRKVVVERESDWLLFFVFPFTIIILSVYLSLHNKTHPVDLSGSSSKIA